MTTRTQKYYRISLLFLSLLLLSRLIQAEEIITSPIRTFTGHSDYVWSVAFSPDGQWALSGSYDDTLKLWDVNTGSLVRTFTGHTDDVRSVAISPDGQWALSGSADKTLKLWEVNTGSLVRTFTGHTYYVNSVAFSPDGQWALSGSTDNTLKLWDMNTGSLVRSFTEHTGYVISVAFSLDGQWALSGSRDNTLKLWDVNTGSLVRSFEGHTDGVLSVAFSPDGQWALSGSYDNTLKLWDVNTGSLIRSFSGHTDFVRSVAISPDGQWALSGSADGTLKLWDVNTGSLVRSFTGHTWYVSSVAFSPDGQWALSDSYKEMKLWDLGLNTAPTANFTLSTSYGESPLEVSFDASNSTDSDGVIAKYDWFINDTLFTSVGSNAPVSYTFPEGQHTIKLIVTDNRGLTASTEKMITVTAPAPKIPPIAAFTVSANTGEAPFSVTLDASTSTDDGSITDYNWTISDGRIKSGRKITLAFNSAGTYTINLAVVDNQGVQSTDIAQETIIVTEAIPDPLAPTAVMKITAIEGLTVYVDGSQSTDSDGSIIEYAWTVGDKVIFDKTTPFSFDIEGEYVISLTVTDDDGLSHTTQETVSVGTGTSPPPITDETTDEIAFVEFTTDLQRFYEVGETVKIELIETVNRDKFTRVDLWVAIAVPESIGGGMLFRTGIPLKPWESMPQPHKVSIENTETSHYIFDFEVPEGMWGEYALYAAYVVEGQDPTQEGGFFYLRSNLAMKKITLANQKD